MKTTSRVIIISAILFLAGIVCAFALDIEGEAPTFTGSNTTLVDAFNNAVKGAFEGALGELKNYVRDIDAKPKDLITAFGSSQVFASSGAASQRGYGDYKIFCFTLNPVTLGLQLYDTPDNFINDIKDYEKLLDKLKEDKDIKLGFNPQAINARIGINTSKFLLKNLYLGLHFGFMKLDMEKFGLTDPHISFESLSLGATVNYQLIPSQKIAKGLLLWRGVNIGTGFIYSGTKIGLSMGLQSYKQDFNDTGNNFKGEITIDPKINLDFKIDTFTIPIEVTTAVKLLWFLNIPLGVGMDVGFGTSDMKVGMKADINTTGMPAGITQSKAGNISATAGGPMPPSAFNLKLMTGVGINIGPVILDIPVTWYFLDNGYSVGVTLGAVW